MARQPDARAARRACPVAEAGMSKAQAFRPRQSAVALAYRSENSCFRQRGPA